MSDQPLTTADVARLLGTSTRQVHAWHTRGTAGFPDPVASVLAPEPGGKRGSPLFLANDVLAWWIAYDPNRGRGAHWSSKPPRRRRTGACEACGAYADVRVADGEPLVHRRCRSTENGGGAHTERVAG